MDELRKSFGALLTELLEKRGMRQYKLAEEIGIEPANVSKWVNGGGFPERPNYLSMCRVLDVAPDYFAHLVTPDESERAKKETDFLKTENAYLKSKVARLESSIESIDAGIWLALQNASDSTIRNVKIVLGLLKPTGTTKSKKSNL